MFEGRVVTTPIYNHTLKNGSLVANFRVGNTRRYFTTSNEEKIEKCYANVVVWVKVAEYCNEVELSVGDLITIYGSLKNKDKFDNDLEIVGRSIKILQRGRNRIVNEEKLIEVADDSRIQDNQISGDQSRESTEPQG
jgi:single-stranded DNA-binding protein